ncbi:hypothetical protein HDU67_003698, partial [Dinochytrium kinnereticum]
MPHSQHLEPPQRHGSLNKKDLPLEESDVIAKAAAAIAALKMSKPAETEPVPR